MKKEQPPTPPEKNMDTVVSHLCYLYHKHVSLFLQEQRKQTALLLSNHVNLITAIKWLKLAFEINKKVKSNKKTLLLQHYSLIPCM